MKSFSLCHEIIPPVVLKSFGLSQDLPLSQNGQNFRRKKSMKQWAIGFMGDGPNGPTGANRKWSKCTISTIYQFSDILKFAENALFSPGESVFFVLPDMNYPKY